MRITPRLGVSWPSSSPSSHSHPSSKTQNRKIHHKPSSGLALSPTSSSANTPFALKPLKANRRKRGSYMKNAFGVCWGGLWVIVGSRGRFLGGGRRLRRVLRVTMWIWKIGLRGEVCRHEKRGGEERRRFWFFFWLVWWLRGRGEMDGWIGIIRRRDIIFWFSDLEVWLFSMFYGWGDIMLRYSSLVRKSLAAEE